MEAIKAIGLMMGASWASGVNLYATVLLLGLSGRMEWVTLPESMSPLTAWPVIIVAGFLYAIEFFADKIPAVDSFWDTLHTFIRPIGGAALAWMAVGESAPEFQVIALLFGSALSLQSHVTKMTARLAINASPEPVTNSVASVTEDVVVAGLVTLAMTHPIIATFVVVALVIGTVWLTVILMKFLVKAVNGILRFIGLKKPAQSEDAPSTPA
ncbi:DUF4126 domain-containing protein [Candidatus Sumerlaeota bacterium]|nr:DUF4126 domain-containing protein [Candidatus Sumerlaeota bacterium]